MLSSIILDVCLQLRRAQNLDIIGQSTVEPADSGIVIDTGLQYPICALPGDVLGSKRVFLQQEVLCPDTEAQLDFLRRLPGHPEHIGALAAVAALEFPVLVQSLNFADA